MAALYKLRMTVNNFTEVDQTCMKGPSFTVQMKVPGWQLKVPMLSFIALCVFVAGSSCCASKLHTERRGGSLCIWPAGYKRSLNPKLVNTFNNRKRLPLVRDCVFLGTPFQPMYSTFSSIIWSSCYRFAFHLPGSRCYLPGVRIT